MKKILAHLLILTYCVITFFAALFSFTKIQITPIPWPVLRYSYGMMAPFQGYSTTNMDLLAEGQQNDGAWVTIDLDPYYPMIRGNQVMYRRLRSFKFEGEEKHKAKYTELAELLQKHEKNRGNEYESIRLTWQEWPASVEGWDAERKAEKTTDYFITQIP